MGNRTIDVDQIKSIEANLNSYTATGNTPMLHGGIVEDESSALLDDCYKKMLQSSEGLSTVVQGLNDFLNKVAAAFTARDQQLKGMIDSNLKEVPYGKKQRQERFIQEGETATEQHNRRKQVDIYNKLHEDLPGG